MEIKETPSHRIALRFATLADFRNSSEGRRNCMQDCPQCKTKFEETGTQFVNRAAPKQPPFKALYWCDGCTNKIVNLQA